ncbi:MAG: BatD family protein, partial [Kiritimatiellae bacterium]|nr:BatD family protein [Kiritimatiellia bacterium]
MPSVLDPRMINVLRVPVLACVVLLFQTCRTVKAQTEPAVSASVNRNRIYLGESFILTVRVAGSTDQAEPDLSALTNCTVRLLDSQAQNFQQIFIVNGRVQKTGFVGRIFTYEVTPSSVGVVVAGPIRATVAGRVISVEGPVVQVDAVEEQEDVIVSVTPSRDSVLVTEPFEITLVIALRGLAGRHADLQPLDPRTPPQL